MAATSTTFDDFLAAAQEHRPAVAVILGSGLGTVVATKPTFASIDFARVPGFAPPTVAGHAGTVLLLDWSGTTVLAFRGRMHFYEGHPWATCTQTVELAATLGVSTLLLTNAAGGIHPSLNVGDLMIIDNHLPLLDAAAWKTPRAVNPYSPVLVERLKAIDPSLLAGTYAGLTGPTYETPAEIRALKAMGADAVGMSTVMEALKGRERGLNVAAISCITNKAAGLGDGTLHHGEVQEVASRGDVVERFANLVDAFIQQA